MFIEGCAMVICINQESDVMLIICSKRILIRLRSHVTASRTIIKGLFFYNRRLRRLVPFEDPFELISRFYCKKILF